MHVVIRILFDAIQRFSRDDGWAIASHIALSILESMFPFLIFVTALAVFLVQKGRPTRPCTSSFRRGQSKSPHPSHVKSTMS